MRGSYCNENSSIAHFIQTSEIHTMFFALQFILVRRVRLGSQFPEIMYYNEGARGLALDKCE